MKNLMILICFVTSVNLTFAQQFSGASAYSTEFDDYLYDFSVLNGKPYKLIKQKLLSYPEVVYASMLDGLAITVNPLYLGNEYSNLHLTLDGGGNVYITGIYEQKIIYDTSYLFISKLNSEGYYIWSKLYEKQSDTIEIYNDVENFIYVHDKHVLYKFDYNGNTIWAKNHVGNIKLYKNNFYNLVPVNVQETVLYGNICDSIILQKLDTSGNQIFQKTINIGTMISTDCSLSILDDKLFISNSYWGELNLDPPNTSNVFENNATGGIWGSVAALNNYLAIYDTIGNLLLANSKPNYPRLKYACVDSAGSLYFAGTMGSRTDFDLITNDSIIVNKSANEISFIAKYSNDLNFYWSRAITGLIKYIGISHYAIGNIEKLDIAGEFDGNINLNLAYPDEMIFESEGVDLFDASYTNLNNNISQSDVRDNNYDDGINLYPNPGTGVLNIQSNSTDLYIEVFDLSGELRYNDFLSKNTLKTIDLSDLNNGYYLVRLKSKNKIYQKKLIICK
ncbi:MAG: T9SS type A sorting domain-containing protein [Bacteroidales bacterium]|nr:T9SS type A sorting domain-containing protein [Bacteroidales bacterium]